jgi:putative effector of murein hydrolase
MATLGGRASAIAGLVLLATNRKGLLEALRLPFAKRLGSAAEPPTHKTLFGVAVLWACDKLVGWMLRTINVTFPSSVATIFATVGALSAVELTVGATAADAALRALTPGVEYLGKWMLLSIAVPLTAIPLSIASGGQWLRLIVVTVGGWLMTISTTAAVANAFLSSKSGLPVHLEQEQRLLMSKAQQSKELDAKPQAKESPNDSTDATAADKTALVEARTLSNRNAWNSLAGVALIALPWVGPAPAQFCITIVALLHAQRLPRAAVQFGLHPLLVCSCAASGLCAVAGSMRGSSFEAALSMFRTQKHALAGPGDLLFEPMNASLVALGLRAFGLRRLLLQHLCPIAAGTLASTVGCLFGTVAVGRLLGLVRQNNLMLSQRCTSGGFAMLVCNIIEAPIPLMFLFNLASGLFGGCLGQVLLDKLGFRADEGDNQRICRGIAMGAASHATGTASLITSGEADTAAIASVSVVVCGVLQCCIVSLPPLRRLLFALAGPK